MAQEDQQRFCLRQNDFQTNMVSSFKLEGPSKKTSYHIPNLIQYTVCQYTSNSPQSGAQLLRFLLQDTQLAREVCQLPKTARTKHIITFYTGSSKGCIPQNTSPPPSLGIGQAGGGYVASLLLSARLGLTHDLLCLCLCLHCELPFPVHTEYTELHTHTHTFILWRLIVAIQV